MNDLSIREISEEREKKNLSPFACLSSESRGRDQEEDKCSIRTEFQRDRDRIIHCKSFRRLKYKTQVFIAPEGDHYRTRLTHTLEVAQIAGTISRALSLNEDLTEAIALGHDLGHTPFGHAGEKVLNELMGETGFRHNEQSLRIVKYLEKNGHGLNLTREVQDGIVSHTGEHMPETLEGQVVRIADRIAYINHDIDDAIRGGIIQESDIPTHLSAKLGSRHSSRINAMVTDLIMSSLGQPEIRLSCDMTKIMDEMRNFMFERVYVGSQAKKEEKKAQQLIKMLFEYYLINEPSADKQHICDYIAGMTDRYAIKVFNVLFVPQPWNETIKSHEWK